MPGGVSSSRCSSAIILSALAKPYLEYRVEFRAPHRKGCQHMSVA